MHIKIDLKIILFAVAFLLVGRIEIYVILMLFGLIHELGHLLCGLLLGLKPGQITLMPYGLKLNFRINYNDYNKKIKKGNLLSIKKIVLYLAGPITNLIICSMVVVLSLFNENIKLLNCSNEQIFYCNLIIAVFNLIPIYPMDGGKILQETIHIFCGLRKSYKVIQEITWISLGVFTAFTSIIILQYKNVFLLLILGYLWGLTIKTEKQLNLKEKIYENLL